MPKTISMTRQHFRALADALGRGIRSPSARVLASFAVAEVCRNFNWRFDTGRFLSWVESEALAEFGPAARLEPEEMQNLEESEDSQDPQAVRLEKITEALTKAMHG
jgi:hypothetical protein